MRVVRDQFIKEACEAIHASGVQPTQRNVLKLLMPNINKWRLERGMGGDDTKAFRDAMSGLGYFQKPNGRWAPGLRLQVTIIHGSGDSGKIEFHMPFVRGGR